MVSRVDRTRLPFPKHVIPVSSFKCPSSIPLAPLKIQLHADTRADDRHSDRPLTGSGFTGHETTRESSGAFRKLV